MRHHGSLGPDATPAVVLIGSIFAVRAMRPKTNRVLFVESSTARELAAAVVFMSALLRVS